MTVVSRLALPVVAGSGLSSLRRGRIKMVDGNRRRVGQLLAGALALATVAAALSAMLRTAEPAPAIERPSTPIDDSPRPTILHVVEGEEGTLSPLPSQHESPARLMPTLDDPASSSAALPGAFSASELR